MRMEGKTMDVSKLNVKQTVFLSFGFLAASLAWALYNSMMPQILQPLTDSNTLTGVIMAGAYITGVVLEPTFGVISDKTHTRIGRRIPYILAGIPICAVAFALAPHMTTLGSLIAVLAVFCVVMAIWRTPTISLMPDLTPGPLRSQANGIVNVMGGLGTLIAFVGGGLLVDLGGITLPFLVAAIIMLVCLAVIVWRVREPAHAYEPKVKEPRVKLQRGERGSLFAILTAIGFWFVGYGAVEAFFTLFATNTLEVSKGIASIMLGVYSIAFMIFAIPAGFIGAKFGRRKMILIGLVGVTAMFVPMMLGAGKVLTIVLLFLGGTFWACVNINSLPMVVRMGTEKSSGTFTGYYYLFSCAGQIIGLSTVGMLIDLTARYGFLFITAAEHYRSLFLFCCLAFAIAAVVLAFAHHGEDLTPQQAAAAEHTAQTDSIEPEKVEQP